MGRNTSVRGDGSRASFTAASRKSKLGRKRLALRLHTLKKPKSQNWRQASLLDFAGGCFDVVRNAHIDQNITLGLERAIAGRRIPVAGLTNRTDHRDPSFFRAQWNLDRRRRNYPRELPAGQ